MRDVVLTDRGAKPIGPYSQAIRASENGRDDGGRYSQTNGTGPGKRSGDRGGRWIEDEPHRQDNGFLEGHERFRNDE